MGAMRKIPLVCFPHAGAGELYYSRWKYAFQDGIDLHIVRYPLRERKMNTPMPTSASELAREVFAECLDVFRGPYAIWGHSMGSIIGYEVAKLCQERLDNAPLVYFSSASSAPCEARFKKVKALDTAEGFNEVLLRYGGFSEELLRDATFMKYFGPTIEADLRLMGSYEDDTFEKLRCPVVLMEGRGDTVTTDAWARYTDHPLHVTEFDGGHFFLEEYRAEMASLMGSKMQLLWQMHDASVDRGDPDHRLMHERR